MSKGALIGWLVGATVTITISIMVPILPDVWYFVLGLVFGLGGIYIGDIIEERLEN